MKENKKYKCICGKEFNNPHSISSHKRFCQQFQIYKKQKKLKEQLSKTLPNGMFICENCGKEHDGSYGSGRFCSLHCRKSFIAKQVKYHKCNFNNRRSSYGTWKCERCDLIFETRRQLQEHNHQFHPIQKGHSWNFGLTKEIDKRIAKYAQTNKDLIASGKIIPHMRGKHHTEEQKKKVSKSIIKFRKSLNADIYNGFIPSYNPKSILIIEQIGKQNNWNFQHAENGGEYYVLGYFVDAYDKEKNIVLEYDEPTHYIDIENNVLREKDLKRQKEIIEHLHCDFYRYNEKTKTLWKVN